MESPTDNLELKGEYCDVPEREIIQVMRFAYPFKEFEMDVIRRVARAGIPIQYEPGDEIISQAEEGDSMFLIIGGGVYLTIELDETATLPARQKQFQNLQKGQTFGEHALVWSEENSHLWQSYRAREFNARAAEFTIVIEFTLQALSPVSNCSH
jgi:CRP-like cAMP-binding protein